MFLANSALATSLLSNSKDGFCPRPSRLKMKTGRDYRSLACVLLRLATAPSRMVQDWSERHANAASHGEGQRAVVGTVVDCNQMFFLTEESSPHAFLLTNPARMKTFLGRKVRITGALQSPHILSVETVIELY